jgi:LysR family transcriptional regulator, transcriptional activator of nhaA
MTKWINYHHLFYFKTIAELGSISRAAEHLLLGQPTLSAQLKQFEESLGVQLFERQHKKLILTEHGVLALDYARNIFSLGGEMYEALHDRSKLSKINVQIAALDSIPKQVTLQMTQVALSNFPCKISLVEGKFDELLREIKAHRVDIAITNFFPRTELTKGLFHRSLSKRPVSLYGAPRFAKLSKNFPKSLADQPVVLPTYDSQMRYDIEHWFKINGIHVDVIAETQDIALKKLMCTNDMAIIPASLPTVNRQVDSGELVEIGKVDGVYEELFLISSERKISNPVAQDIMKNFTLP